MPYMFAHNYCATKMLEDSQYKLLEKSKQKINANIDFFLWGAQGPDIWFYHKVFPWSKNKNEGKSAFGTVLHHEKVSRTFESMINTTINLNGEEKDKAFAYVCGYVCHYALDCAAHPYIFYKTETMEFHTRFESDIDVALMQSFGKNSINHPTTKNMPVWAKKHQKQQREDFKKVVEKIYIDVAQKIHYNLSIRSYKEMIEDAIFGVKILNDAVRIKRPLVIFFERIIKKPNTFSNAIYKRYPTVKINSLNTLNRPWQKPWEDTVLYLSFFDLMQQAMQNSKEYIESIYSSVYESKPLKKTLEILGNNSFDTGMPCDASLVNKNYGCVYK